MVHDVSAGTASPRERRRAAARVRILDAAESILEADGLEALTMQRLASELGYTVGAAYRYFASKDALIAALQGRVFETLAADLRAALERHEDEHPRASRVGALTRVAIAGRSYATHARRHPTHARLLQWLLGDPRNVVGASAGAAMAAAASKLGAEAVRELEAAAALGALEPGDGTERALLLWAGLSGLAQARKLERWRIPGLDVDALGERMVHALVCGWGARGSVAREAIARARAYV